MNAFKITELVAIWKDKTFLLLFQFNERASISARELNFSQEINPSQKIPRRSRKNHHQTSPV